MIKKVYEALKPGDLVECPRANQKGHIVDIQYPDEGEPIYRVQYSNGKTEWLERSMLVKIGQGKKTAVENQTLLATLVESLKGKSVYKTLKALSEGKVEDSAVALKGLFSLGTHVAIEVEHGRKEYRTLLPFVVEKINHILENSYE
jgi:hypothetical protein